MRLRVSFRSVLWLVTIAFGIGLVTNLAPWLRGGFGWVWLYGLPRPLWLLPCVVGVTVYTVGAYYLLKNDPGWQRLTLWAFVWSALLPILLLTLQNSPLFELFARTASVFTGGYEYAATRVTGLHDLLTRWPAFVLDYRKAVNSSGGVALDPPALTAMVYLAQRIAAGTPPLADTFGILLRPIECQNRVLTTWTNAQYATAWLQMAMALWGAFAVVPLRRLGRAIVGDGSARIALALWPLVPGMALFTPRFNVIYPLLALTMLVFAWRGVQERRALPLLMAGFITSAATFLNLSLVPLGLLGGLLIVMHADRKQWQVAIRQIIAFGLGSASVWALYGALSGVTVFDIVSLSLDQHLSLDRPYLPWLFLHPYDMFLFIGLPVSWLAIMRAVGAFNTLRLHRPLTASDRFALALALTLIILVLSGTARGETGRVWLFFAPCWLLLAADWLMRRETLPITALRFVEWGIQGMRSGARAFATLAPMQALCLLCMAAVLRVEFTTFTVPPNPPAADPATYAVNAHFGSGADRFTFVGLGVDKSADQITLQLHWRGDTLIQRPYVLSLIMQAPDGQPRPNLNWTPYDWQYPPTCWTPGKEFVDSVTIPTPLVPGDPPVNGDWVFSLSAFDANTHIPLAVNGQSEQPQVGIGPVHYP
ncbi:MAG: hypothetical protein ACYDBJ_15630 [Aggregatilineales bacterium]